MEPTEPRGQPKILIVEDDPQMRLALQVRLKANNYAMAFAFDGISAIAEARRQSPDVILLDIGLPAGDGYVVLDRLQANDTLACIPVIVVSGRDRATNRDRVLKGGARAFLQKPVRNADLLLAIEQVLSTPPPSGPVVYDITGAPYTTVLDARARQDITKSAA